MEVLEQSELVAFCRRGHMDRRQRLARDDRAAPSFGCLVYWIRKAIARPKFAVYV